MKSKEMHVWLEAHIKFLERGCSESNTIGLRRLQSLFAVRETASIKDVCTAVERSSATVIPSEGVVVRQISDLVDLMVTCAATVANATARRELQLFSDTLRRHQDFNLENLLATATKALTRPQRVAQTTKAGLSEADIRDYLRRLEEALGDEEGFKEEYARLTSDNRVKAPEAKRIAKAFAGKSGRSKSDALGLIAARQQSLVGARAKANATGGRSAA